MSILAGKQNPGNVPNGLIDSREQLWNEGLTGPAGLIQLPTERITRLRGILLDLDPAKLIAENPWFPPADDPVQFHANIKPVLQRHPLARDAEIRLSGTGLHGIIWLDPPVELTSAAEQNKWANVVRMVRCSLPVDPNAPGITALTRAVGSINSKNDATVEVLEPGEPIEPARVIAFVEGLVKAPFKTVATILLGCDHIQPCPICRRDDTHLDVLDSVGKCYGRCGNVKLNKVLDTIYKPLEPAQTAGSHK
jgi:hypothetical protein